jgi:hypothetical protein
MTTTTFTHHDQPIRLSLRRDHVDAAIAAVAFVLLLPGAAFLMSFLTA